jgi:8-oxo-dGTP diphosphatase
MMDVTCAIIVKGDKILVAQRSEKMSPPLKWEFPGGKIEPSETAENCLKREIKEELNLDIDLIEKLESQLYKYELYTITLIPFISNYLSGEIALNEHKCVKWLTKEELVGLDWAPAEISVLHSFLKLNDDATRSL